jgi:hypothetical protein
VGLLSTGAAMMIALFTNSRHGISEHVAVDDATKQEPP